MQLVDRDNVLAAQYMYSERVKFLRSEVPRIVNLGVELGENHEAEIMFALDEIEQELEGIDECLELLKHLLRG